ncbi:magnesium chelatase subunit D [Halogranum amylolyticum]|uniref:Magnesium chelatase subunit D n=1 Tax=Halogranum amylolyticum TaxID=660520 RepID=A0A1H8VRS2_9EURY|nr:VWA domain-containing protein [Halogranum amylolyticum]SEP18091.1 magnesium chelatase subunit D [Halogranum amylolyticum]
MVDFGRGKKASHVREKRPSFSEIVGQEELKRALLAVASNTDLDGLLIQGEKGTAKSTAVRALTELLPRQSVIANCPYGCPPNATAHQCEHCRERTNPQTTERSVPLVTLPLGATRERVVGTLSVADALAGDYEFDPGLLARANRGILYVDEVNLLDDHLVDVLLDAAASGVNRVERDGVSVVHPAQFTLVGTMNPEEGDLRPQLRDRFALQATVTACDDIEQRVSIIDQAIGRTGSDVTERANNGPRETEDVRSQLREARKRLPEVELSTQFAREIAELCRNSGADGHRGDIATARAAMTFAALDERSKVIEPDVQRAVELALPHRLQSRPFEDDPDPSELIDDHFDDGDTDEHQKREEERHEGDQSDRGEEFDRTDGSDDIDGTDGPDSTSAESSQTSESDDAESEASSTPPSGGATNDGAEAQAVESAQETERSDSQQGDTQREGTPLVPGQSRADVGEALAPDLSASEAIKEGKAGSGTRSRTRPHVDNEGSRVRSQRTDSTRRIDAAASVRAATTRGASSVESRDLRQSVRQSDASALVVFVVDASASMLPAMRAAKGTLLELLKDAYQQRDEVAFVAFAGDEADVLLPPTNSVTLAARHLKDLPTGDRTPLPAGLRTASDVLDRAEPAASVVVLVTDGRANVADESPVRETREAARRLTEFDTHVVVVDASSDDRTGLTGVIADETGGERIPLSALSAGRIDAAVDTARET